MYPGWGQNGRGPPQYPQGVPGAGRGAPVQVPAGWPRGLPPQQLLQLQQQMFVFQGQQPPRGFLPPMQLSAGMLQMPPHYYAAAAAPAAPIPIAPRPAARPVPAAAIGQYPFNPALLAGATFRPAAPPSSDGDDDEGRWSPFEQGEAQGFSLAALGGAAPAPPAPAPAKLFSVRLKIDGQRLRGHPWQVRDDVDEPPPPPPPPPAAAAAPLLPETPGAPPPPALPPTPPAQLYYEGTDRPCSPLPPPDVPPPYLPATSALIRLDALRAAARWASAGRPAPVQIDRANLKGLNSNQASDTCVAALARYVEACGGSADLIDGWTATVEVRKEGNTAGTYDVYYFDPLGRRYRSRAEVARAFALAAPARAPKVPGAKGPANFGFGRTKKARRRAAHARRFAALTVNFRKSLANTLDDAKRKDEGGGAGDDDERPKPAPGESRVDRLTAKLADQRQKEAAAKQRLAAADAHARAHRPPPPPPPAPPPPPPLPVPIGSFPITGAPAPAPAFYRPPPSAEELEKQRVRCAALQAHQVAVARHQNLLKEVERERRTVERLVKATQRLEELLRDATAAAERRAAADSERRRKKAAKEAETLAKRAEREADAEARRDKRSKDAATRKAERDEDAKQRRAEKDSELAAAAANRALAEMKRKQAERYPVDDALLDSEPPPDPPLPPRPEASDPSDSLLRGVPRDAVGDVLAIHALLRAIGARRTALGLKRVDKDATPVEELPAPPPPLEAFGAALAAPLGALGGARGALEPLRRAHGALLEVLLDDASADGWWAPLDATRDAAFFAESSDEESGGAKRKSKRKAAHPWARVTRRFSRAAQARLAADDVDLLREADDDADASPDGLNAAVEAIVKDLRRGAEADADTRRWVGAVDQCERAAGDGAARDALRCAARLTTVPRAQRFLERLAALDATAAARGAAASLAAAARKARPRAWKGAAADRDAARRADADEATRTWERYVDGVARQQKRAADDDDAYDSADAAADDDSDDEFKAPSSKASSKPSADVWRVDGSEYVGRTVRRSVLDDAGQVASHSDGLVAGWLDDTASDYVDAAGNAAALWHVTLETGELAGDEEDLELHEVLESLVPLEAAPLRPPAGAPVDDDETEDEDEAAPAPPPKQPLKRGPTKRKAQAKKPGGADASLFPERAERPSGGDRRRGRKAKKTTQKEYALATSTTVSLLGGSTAAAFPKEAMRVALVADALDRKASKKRKRELRDAPPPPEDAPPDDDDFGDLIDAPPEVLAPVAELRLPRPPKESVGPSTWAALAGAVGSRLAARDGETCDGHVDGHLDRASKWLSEGLPYGGLGARERVAVLKALCDAYAASYGCATLVDEAAEGRALRDATHEADERDRKRRAAEKERDTSARVRERLAVELAAQQAEAEAKAAEDLANGIVPQPVEPPKAKKPAKPRKRKPKQPKEPRPDDDGDGNPRKRPRPRPGAAPPPLSSALDKLIACDAPCAVDARNPKLPGSRCHALYERYSKGATIKEVMKLGGRRGDIFNDLARGYTVLTNPEHRKWYEDAKVAKGDGDGSKPDAPSRTPSVTPSVGDAALDAASAADDAGSEAPNDAPRPPPPPPDAGDEDPEVARALGASPPPPSGESVASASPRASPRASPSSLACVPAAQPTRHRFRAEVAHVRAVDACGGGDVEFVGFLALERREQASPDGAASSQARRPARLAVMERLKGAAARLGGEGDPDYGDVLELRAAVADAKSDAVLLEGVFDAPPPPPPDDDDAMDVDAMPPLSLDGEARRKRWVTRELADAYEALRDVELRLEETERRRARAQDVRAHALPRMEPLGSDRHRDVYWTFPRLDVAESASAPPRPPSPVRVWKERRAPPDAASTTPTWGFYVGDDAVRRLALSLDERGVRERDLRATLLDLLPLGAPPPAEELL